MMSGAKKALKKLLGEAANQKEKALMSGQERLVIGGDMAQLKDAFEKLFDGHKVDIATPSILNNPYRKQAIERDMEELYVA